MAVETPDSLTQVLQSDRRPAIWPWLVMPLVALSLFYWFYSLDQLERARDTGRWHPPPTPTPARPDPGTQSPSTAAV